MDRARTETAALARRIVSRTLLVLGGAVAGTAAAWALSAATASADTGADHGTDHLAGVQITHPVQTASTLVGQVEHLAHDLVPPAAAQTRPQPGALTGIGRHAVGIVDRLRADLHQRVTETTARASVLVLPVRSGTAVATGAPGDVSPVLGPVGHPAGPRLTPVRQHGPDVDPTVRNRAGSGGHNRGSPHSLPGLPTAPLAPLPTCPAGHGTSAGTATGPAVAAWPHQPVPAAPRGTAPARPVRTGTSVHTGAQPGSTPD